MKSFMIAVVTALILGVADLASADLLTLPVPVSAPVGVGPYAFLIGGETADTVTTIMGEAAGTHELNSIVGSGSKRLLMEKVAASSVMALMIYAIGQHHPTVARILGYVSGGVSFGVAAHNYSITKR
jgi:hypothetical protein